MRSWTLKRFQNLRFALQPIPGRTTLATATRIARPSLITSGNAKQPRSDFLVVLRLTLLAPIAVLLALVLGCDPSQGGTPSPAGPAVTSTTAAPIPTSPPSSSTAPSPPSTTKPTTRNTPSSTKAAASSHSREACLRDENQCYEPGTNIKCQTGGCVNAARGLTPSDVKSTQQQWLRQHPGWCAVGTQGAVAPC
jgi:hypothetical protein